MNPEVSKFFSSAAAFVGRVARSEPVKRGLASALAGVVVGAILEALAE
jgi:hypothetical protein